MPARSNDFQRLIFTIESQLAGEATVTESQLLPDRDGTPREVDIAIEMTVGVHPVRVAVECRDHARAADVTWIEQLYGKYRDLAVNQVVAVAKAGFTKAARAKAAAYHIRALTLEEAKHMDWAQSVRAVATLDLAVASYLIAGDCALTFAGDQTPPDLDAPVDDHLPVFAWAGGPRLTLEQLLNGALTANRANIEALEATFAASGTGAGSDTVALTLGFTEQVVLLGTDGTAWPLQELVLPVRRGPKPTIAMKLAEYGSAAVSYGEATFGGFRYRVVSAARRDKLGNAPISITVDPMPPWLIGRVGASSTTM